MSSIFDDPPEFADWEPHDLNAETGDGVWVVLSLYVAFLIGIAVYGFYRSCYHKYDKPGAKTEDHYNAGQSLGIFVLPLTYFATMFSGYTVVGIPGEVWRTGWFGFRWIGPLLQWYQAYNVFVASRLCFLSQKRGYISPTDFISDRFRSRTLTLVVSIAMIFPTLFYVLAQFKSMGGTIAGLSDGKIEPFEASAVFCAIMITYEIFGGLRGVAWTDALQGGVMVTCFLFFHLTMKELFGGVPQAGDFMEQYDDTKSFFDGVDIACTELGKKACKRNDFCLYTETVGCGPYVPTLPENKGYNEVLTDNQVHAWINFGALMLSYSLYPQMIARCNAAKSTKTLQRAMLFTHIGGWISMLSGSLTGIIAIYWFGPPGTEDVDGNVILESSQSNDIYGQVMRVAIANGGGNAVLGTLMITASAAAFMSTADSGLIAASSLLTLDVWARYVIDPMWDYFAEPIKGIFFNDKENLLLILGKITSIALGITVLIVSDMDIELGPLFALQGGLLCQLVPAYCLGMLVPWVKPLPCVIGILVGIATTVGIQCDNGTTGCVQPTGWVGPVKEVAPGLLAMFINAAISLILSLEIWVGDQKCVLKPAVFALGDWDKIEPDTQFAGPAFPKALIGLDLSKSGGPKVRPYYFPQIFLLAIVVFVQSFTTPWYAPSEWGKPTNFTAHLPDYIFNLLIISVFTTIAMWALILYFWSDEDFEKDERFGFIRTNSLFDTVEKTVDYAVPVKPTDDGAEPNTSKVEMVAQDDATAPKVTPQVDKSDAPKNPNKADPRDKKVKTKEGEDICEL